MKIFFSTLLWMAVFDIYTVPVVYDFKPKEDAISPMVYINNFIGYFVAMIIFFLWKFWALAWGHYYLIIKKIKNTRVYYLTSILYILAAGALWMIVVLYLFDENTKEEMLPALVNILSLWKKHILQPYLLIYVLTAFLLAFLQKRQFKDLSKAKIPSDDLQL